MGGFILHQHEKPVSVLTFNRLVSLIEAGEVDIPTVTENTIYDKSKGDFLTKLFVLLQTTWFVAQCLARWATRLPVTEIEVVTLAFAALNIVTCCLWWYKPQNVHVAVPVELRSNRETGTQLTSCRTCGNRVASSASIPSTSATYYQVESVDRQQGKGGSRKTSVSWIWERMKWNWWATEGRGLFSWVRFTVWQVPVTLLRGLLRPLYKMAGDVDIDVEAKSTRLPMFYAHDLGYQKLFISIAFLFGSLHLLSWSASFPSDFERWLWRSCAIFITTEPAILLVYRRLWAHEINGFTDLAVLVSLTIYCFARLALMVLSCTTLRALPPDAYRSIQWTSFLPHV